MKDGTTEHTEGTEGAAGKTCNLQPSTLNGAKRLPPHDLEAERYVLGWSLTHPVPACVHPALFHFRAYGLIVEAVRTGGMYSERMTPDLINEAGAVLGTVWPVWDARTFNAAVEWLGHLAKQREALALMERMVEAIYAGAVVAGVSDFTSFFGGKDGRKLHAVSVDQGCRVLNGWRPWESVSEIHTRESGMPEGVKA